MDAATVTPWFQGSTSQDYIPMSYDNLTYERRCDGDVAVVTIVRPEAKNAVD